MQAAVGRGLRWAAVWAVVAASGAGCNQGARPEGLSAQQARVREARRARVLRDRILSDRPYYTQHKEELIIRHFFADRREGFFVDVGCARPRTDSNTCYLEYDLGWSGIAVDALAEYASAWRERRPRSKFFNYFVSDHSDGVTPFYRSELRGVSSYLRQNVERRNAQGREFGFNKVQVPTITLTRLLEENGVARIDLLSMDIEGAEPLALAGFDIDRFRPELVCVEAKPAVRARLAEYFDAHGYARLTRYAEYDVANYYYAPRAAGRSDK